MITTETVEDRVEARLFGEFSLADFQDFAQQASYCIKFHGRIDLFIDLRDMTGFTLDVVWKDLQFSREHSHDFRRVAVLTESSRDTWVAFISQFFIDGDIQVFNEEMAAREWLAQAQSEAEE